MADKDWIPIPRCPIRFRFTGFFAVPTPGDPGTPAAGNTIWTSPSLGREGGKGPVGGKGRHWDQDEVPLNAEGVAENVLRLPPEEPSTRPILEGTRAFPVTIQLIPEGDTKGVTARFFLRYVTLKEFRTERTPGASATKTQFGYTLRTPQEDKRVEVWFEGKLDPVVPPDHQMQILSLLLNIGASPVDDSHDDATRVQLVWYSPQVQGSEPRTPLRFEPPRSSGQGVESRDWFYDRSRGVFQGYFSYWGYPSRNSHFGDKTLTVYCNGNVFISQAFQVFFPSRDGGAGVVQNHPTEEGDPATADRMANWFYYWSATKDGPASYQFVTVRDGKSIVVTYGQNPLAPDLLGDTVGRPAQGWGRKDPVSGELRVTLYEAIVAGGDRTSTSFRPPDYVLLLSTGQTRVVQGARLSLDYAHGGIDLALHIFHHEMRHIFQVDGGIKLNVDDETDTDADGANVDYLFDLFEDSLGTSFRHLKTFGQGGIVPTPFTIKGVEQPDHEFDADHWSEANHPTAPKSANWAIPWKTIDGGADETNTVTNAGDFQWEGK
ncbi:MAG: hypothetical protein HY720_30985 [Planctomycetes bacterium]|nr:hypothetical protein [Planctomycetota bacterium]